MFCPNCRYEFRRGFTRCNECGVALVETLSSEEVRTDASATTERMVSPTLLWRGRDDSTFNDIRVALDSAGIAYNREELDARLLYTDHYDPLEIWVPAAKLPDARKLVEEVLSRDDSAAGDAQQLNNAYELPAEDVEGDDDIRDENVARELDPEDATAEIWSGADATTAEMLKSCLAEIGIACYVDRPESGNLAVRVLPEDEKRSRAIVHQVVEGVPPE
ncbi:MAG TPA: hypothetical protein VGT03_01115 [Candidatus Acidoferrales bacterium]|nr:hypothetical protein [Candidatus Acidoferrales bacterium]